MGEPKDIDERLLHWGVKGMKWDKRKKKKDPEIEKLKKQYGISDKDAADLKRLIKERKLSPKQVADVVAMTKAVRNAKPFPKGKTSFNVNSIKENAAIAKKEQARANKVMKKQVAKAKKEQKANTPLGRLKKKLKSVGKKKSNIVDGSAPFKPTVPGIMKDGRPLNKAEQAIYYLKNRKKIDAAIKADNLAIAKKDKAPKKKTAVAKKALPKKVKKKETKAQAAMNKIKSKLKKAKKKKK